MTSLASLVNSYTRTPTATCYLDGKRWYGIQKLRYSQRFGENIAGGGAEGRAPPVTPRIGMSISWKWGYNGYEVAGCTGEISDYTDFSYPDRWALQVKDVLWRADKSSQVIQTDPLNDITARAAIIYILTHYGALSASRLQIPALSASGSAWVGSEWVLGTQTPVAWGDLENNTGGTTAIKAAQEIASCLGYWIYATPDGKVTAKLLERKPSTTAREVFERNVNLLLQGAPERHQNYDSIYNQVTVLGGNTGVLGSQIRDQFRTSHPLLAPGIYRDFPFSSFLIEYVNESEAGAASATAIAKRILNVVSRTPDVIPLRAKADPNRKVGDTVGLIDTGVLISAQRNFFIYALDRELDLAAGRFDDQLTLDGGTGGKGYTTVPPPDASFDWRLMAETLDGTPVVEVFLDGSASTSPSGEIVSYSWSTTTPTYGSTPDTAMGEQAVLIFEAADSPADITLQVVDTTSKIGAFDAAVDLTGADTRDPIQEVVSAAAGAAWLVTPDGGATWNSETSNGDAIAVGTIGGGADDRAAPDSGTTYGLVATRGSGGAGGIRGTLDHLATASTNLVANSGAITSNIWVNEANPARIWFAIGDTPYRSVDGGLTKTAMAVPAAGVDITWVMEDPAVIDSVFLLAGPDMYNATAPTLGWALLYEGPVGATARQFVRSRDGQVTWVCYTDAPAGEALQRVESGAAADFDATDVRTLALDRQATSLRAALYAVTGDDPAEIWSFDGITGLSAVQSSQAFPAGATVQHMLGSRQAEVIYTADFDSVAVGTGALRKYFPQADALLLWKELASGQQGHMLGLGARAVSPAELLMVDKTGGGVWHFGRGGWADATGDLPISGHSWRGIVSSPTDMADWTIWDQTSIYRTANAGVNWTEIAHGISDLGAIGSQGIRVVQYAPDGLAIAVSAATRDTFLNKNVGAVGTYTPAGTLIRLIFWDASGGSTVQGWPNGLAWMDSSTVAFAVDPAADNGGFPGQWQYLSKTGSSGAGVGTLIGEADAAFRMLDMPPGALGLIGLGADGGFWRTTDPAVAPTQEQTFAGDALNTAAATQTTISAGDTAGVHVFAPGGTPVAVLDTYQARFVRADPQTRTHVAAYLDTGATQILALFDGTDYALVPLPPAGAPLTKLADWVEVLGEVS